MDGTPRGRRGRDRIRNLFKHRRDHTMPRDFKTKGGFLPTDWTIPRPGLKLIMGLRGGGDRDRLATSDGLGGRDGAPHTSRRGYGIKLGGVATGVGISSSPQEKQRKKRKRTDHRERPEKEWFICLSFGFFCIQFKNAIAKILVFHTPPLFY